MPRVNINVQFKDKDDAKSLGARWDPSIRSWYIPEGIASDGFHRWLTESDKGAIEEVVLEEVVNDNTKGVLLSKYLSHVKGIVAKNLSSSEWVRCEIANINERNGNYYLELIESNSGTQLAKVRSHLWNRNASALLTKFQESTGSALSSGQSVLLQISATFHELYGFSTVIKDIDPSYTLGDMEAKLQRLRVKLQKEGIYKNNKAFETPSEFTRIAVISPENAAGLGDFASIMQSLTLHKLCQLEYYPAIFQGGKAELSLSKAITQVFESHNDSKTYDLLVVIRGGGSKADLSWLNNEVLARDFCKAPLAIYTGIGHQRDSCLLDELSLRSFETPSSLAAHIFSTIVDNARIAKNNISNIKITSSVLIEVAKSLTKEEQISIDRNARAILNDGIVSSEKHYINTGNYSLNLLQTTNKNIEYINQKILTESIHKVAFVRQGINSNFSDVRSGALRTSAVIKREVDEKIIQVDTIVKRDIKHIHHNLNVSYDLLSKNTQWIIEKKQRELKNIFSELEEDIEKLTAGVREKINRNFQLVLAHGAGDTLNRGFVLVRNTEGKVITSLKLAKKYNRFEIEFHDGKLVLTKNK